MCGIAGILNFDRQRPASAEVLERMLLSILHRGPDEDGRLVDRELAMGMRRLSIIDLADGTQPIFDESGRYAVVFNGEIYNYRELRQDLIARGHHLKTQSDTEVIVHLYEEQGVNSVEHLRGMFGIALWDQQARELVLIRDRLGIKPLYYAVVERSLIFGSEIKAILEHPSITRRIDFQSMSDYLSMKYVPAPRTMFDGIHSLPPGHWLRVRNGQVEIQRYWNVSFKKPAEELSDQEYEDRLLELLRESVRLRLRSDVPFGAFLSGGVDSSTIVALMAEQMAEPVKTFSVGFEGVGEQDELPYAQQVADRFGCEHHTLIIRAADFHDQAENVLWHLDQPIADQATVATNMVAKLARQHVKMVLTGEGGDELFAGYARYVGESYAPWTSRIPAVGGALIRRACRLLPGMRRAKIALQALSYRDEATRYANWFPMFNDELKSQLFDRRWRELQQGLELDGVARIYQQHLSECDATEPLDRMLYVDSKLWLPDYLLLRGDKLTMANSLEGRVPLLDHRLVEFAGSLPTRLKLNGKVRKYLLKQVAARLIPLEIIHRKKQGFPIPIHEWLRSPTHLWMQDHLSEEVLKRRGFFNVGFVRRLIQEHQSRRNDHSTELWGLISLEIWMRRFMDK